MLKKLKKFMKKLSKKFNQERNLIHSAALSALSAQKIWWRKTESKVVRNKKIENFNSW